MPYLEIDAEGNPVEVEGEDGTVTQRIIDDPGSWDIIKNHIPEELQEEKMWENVKDTAGLLKSYAHAQKLTGSSIRLPGEEATEEDWNEIFTKLGRPEDLEGYGEIFPDLPEGITWDESAQQGFKAAAHKAGLNPGQAKEILAWYSGYQRDVALEADREMGQTEEALQQEWGANYDINLSLATRAVAKVGGQALQQLLDTTGLGNHPEMIKTWARVGRILAEDKIIPAEVEGASTSQAARDKIASINADAEHPYHVGDQAAVEEMRKLFQLAYPDL